MSELRWGILGTGAIACDFAQALAQGGLKLEAVASRTYDKAQAFADKYGARMFFASYDELIKSSHVDIVYVATPHNLHFEWAEKALRAGKHVLCEKAITVNGDELDRLCAAAEKNGVVLREAMTIYHMPIYDKLRAEIGVNARLGALKTLDIAFGSTKPYDPQNRFFNPDLAGGAMLDIGVYALSAARLFMSETPDTVLFEREDAPSGVDERWSIILKNRRGETGTVNIAFRTKLPKRAVIACERGYIVIDDYPRADKAEIVWSADGTREEVTAGESGKALLYEALSVEAAVAEGDRSGIMTLTRDVMEIMDRVRR